MGGVIYLSRGGLIYLSAIAWSIYWSPWPFLTDTFPFYTYLASFVRNAESL
jgi:hypothetical protein